MVFKQLGYRTHLVWKFRSGIFTGLMFLFLSSLGVAQTGPGGVGTNTGNSNLSLWLDATLITGYADDQEVDTVYDQSGKGNNAYSAGNAPRYITQGGGNNNPALEFEDGDDEYLLVPTNEDVMPDGSSDLSVFVVAEYEDGSDDWAGIICTSDDNGWNDGWGICEDDNNGDILFYTNNYASNFCDNEYDNSSDQIYTLTFDNSRNVGYGAESADSCTWTYTGNLSYNGGANDDVLIGTAPNNGGPNYFMTGHISEVIIFDTLTNKAQRIIIENYLAAKYDIALDNFDYYNEDDNGDYDFDVAGIGQLDNQAHDDSRGTGIVRMRDPSSLNNDDFLFWGHDNGALAASNTSDIDNTVTEARFSRVWRMSERNDVGTVDIRVDLTGLGDVNTADLQLLIDTDDNNDFDDETPITGPTDLGSNIYEFANVSTIGDNLRFTFATANQARTSLGSSGPTGPGGVGSTDGSSDLVLWLDANQISGLSNNDDVANWTDLSGRENNASTGTTYTCEDEPTYRTSQINGMPTVYFNADQYDVLEITASSSMEPDDLTILGLWQPQACGNGCEWGAVMMHEDNDNWNDGYCFGCRNDQTNDWVFYADEWDEGTYPTAWGGGGYNTNFNNGTPYVLSMSRASSDGDQYFYQNDAEFSSDNTSGGGTTVSYTDNNPVTIGGYTTNPCNDEYVVEGHLPELIMYQDVLNDAEMVIVINYLAAKYGTALSNSDVYQQDDNGYDFDVAGIGRVNLANAHDDAQGTGILRVNNPSNLGNDEFFMWGHDNGDFEASEITDVPTGEGVAARFDRVWAVSELKSDGTTADNVGDVDMIFDLSYFSMITSTDLVLLIDVDDDGNFDDCTVANGGIVENPTSLGGGKYEFEQVDDTDLDNGTIFTIGTKNRTQTPLPVELLDFSAKALSESEVELTWSTATEFNNDYFTLERSINGFDWADIARVEGAGFSNERIDYAHFDENLKPMRYYYRLKQTDFNGQYKYHKVVSVDLSSLEQLAEQTSKIFPNPTDDYVILEGGFESMEDVRIFNLQGAEITRLVAGSQIADDKIRFDFSTMPEGLYFIKSGDFTHKLLVQ